MGTFNVELEIGDPDRQRFKRVNALVDSRATYAFLPSSLLNDLGVKPHRTMNFRRADGSLIERGFAQTWARLNGEDGIIPVIFAEDGAIPVLGSISLTTLGLEADEANERLVPVKARFRVGTIGYGRISEG